MIHNLRAIAFYLPQYHPVRENDVWWGKGFTEWTNVTKAKSLYDGHYQPQLPADLGFYDLRLPEARQAQAELAAEYGIHGFCYYHYWFNGRRILERPFEDVLASKKPNFPFCLCWANENWTRMWDGLEKDVLLQQNYSPDDDVAHIRSLLPAFRDDRYIKVDGKPLLMVYRFGHLPDPVGTIERWRAETDRAGLPGIYLANVESFTTEHALAGKLDLDAAVEFAPDWNCLPPPIRPKKRKPPLFLKRRVPEPWKSNSFCKYEGLVERMVAKQDVDYVRYRCVTPSWDNTPRRKGGITGLVDSTPQAYELWLKQTAERFVSPTREENFIFINAWNEWAEGNHLEPCQKWGRKYLEATARVLKLPTA